MTENKANRQRGLGLSKKKLLVGSGVALLLLLAFGLFKVLWRADIPSELWLPNDTKVIVSRTGDSFNWLPANLYYLRSWCKGQPQEVAQAWATRLKHDLSPPPYYLVELDSTKIYQQSNAPLDDFFPSVYAGPLRPTSAAFSFSRVIELGDDSAKTSIKLWADGKDTQIEVLVCEGSGSDLYDKNFDLNKRLYSEKRK